MSFGPEQTEEPAVLEAHRPSRLCANSSRAEYQVELRSSELKKELGSAHVMFWVSAALLFYIPSGIVVAHLAKEMPLAGGLYVGP